MPDTGAPWNIPYVASTDLVSDWPTDSQELADAIADGLDAAGNAGIGSNAAQTVKTDTFTTTSTTFTPLTGLSVNFTPTSATSKVLVIANIMGASANSSAPFQGRVLRASSEISPATSLSNRTSTTLNWAEDPNARTMFSSVFMFIDSPATASQVTYSVEVRMSPTGGTSTGYINRTEQDADSAYVGRSVSSITAIEVAV